AGLEKFGEVTGTDHRVGVTAKFLSPFWRGPVREVIERIAPPVKALITADPGSPVNRWDDPEFADTVAYEPWFVVDGGLEKDGTGAHHGVWVAGHDIEVSPGETISVSAGLSYVDGPNVGAIQVRVRAYDSNSTLVAGSEKTVIAESYAGTYTGTYAVPATGVEIELGFFTASGVHANTRVRIDSLDVKRAVQYLARYEWEGEPHESPSIKRDHTGNIAARNLSPNPSYEKDRSTGIFRGSAIGSIGSAGQPERVFAGDLSTFFRVHEGGSGNRATVFYQQEIGGVQSGQWVAFGVYGYASVDRYMSGVISERSNNGSSHVAHHSDNDYRGFARDNIANARVVMAQQLMGPDTDTVRVGIDVSKSSSGVVFTGEEGYYYLDGWTVAVADTEAEALAQVEEYFDGDMLDVVDEVCREGSYSFPFFPVFLADSTVQGEHELRVEGDAPVWPVWEIQGPGRDVEIIGPDGSRLFVEGEVSSPVTIVTEPGKRSIRDATGLIWDRMKPGDDQFFALEPGEQTVKMTMVGGNPESTIRAVYSENWKTPRGTAQVMIRGGVV